MDPKNTDEAPSSSSSFPHAHEGAPDPSSPSSSSLPADSTLRRTSPLPTSSSSSSSSLSADSTLRPTSPPPASSSHPLIPSILYCNFCWEEFDDFEVLVEHIMCEHPRHLDEDKPPSPSPSPSSPSPSPASPWNPSHGDGPSFNCYECEEAFRDFQAWLDHSANSHPFEPSHEFVVPQSPEVAPPQERVVRLIRCTLCRQTFLPQEEMCRHVRNAHAPVSAEEILSSTERICHLCGTRFANSDQCRRHVWGAHSPIITICGQIWAQRPSSSSVAAAPPGSSSAAAAAGQGLVHAALQGQEEAGGPRFNCRSCSSSFASGRELTNHVWAAHPPIITVCGRVVAPQPPAGSGVGGPVVGAQTAAAEEEFLSYLDSGGYLNQDEQPPSPPPADG